MMAMVAGTQAVELGSLARAIYDNLNTAFGVQPDPTDDETRRKACAAISQAIVLHIQANADLLFNPAHPGLQTSTALGTPTGPPATPIVASAPIVQ